MFAVQLLHGEPYFHFSPHSRIRTARRSKEHRRICLYGRRYKTPPIFSRRCKRRPATFSLLEVELQFMIRIRIEHI